MHVLPGVCIPEMIHFAEQESSSEYPLIHLYSDLAYRGEVTLKRPTCSYTSNDESVQ